MNELKFQKNLVDAANNFGGHGFKANNRFLVGVADLSIKLPDYPHIFLECKKHNTLTGTQNTGLTPHQREFLKNYRKAGGVAGWVTFAPVKGQRDYYDIFASTDVSAVRVDFDASMDFYCKHRGGLWPIEWIVNQIVKGHGVHKSYSKS